MFIHSHKKRKDSLERRAALLIFLLELEISGMAVQRIHQTVKIAALTASLRNLLMKMTLRLF